MPKKIILSLLVIICSTGITCCYAQTQQGKKERNLLLNGNFTDSEDPLNHWIYAFDNNSFYMENHKYVTVTNDPLGLRPNVMRIDVTDKNICINQGVMVYSAPIRFDPTKKYKISLSASSQPLKGSVGPKCRVYAIGYRWHPKAVKSNNPAFQDLREAVRFQPIYFDNSKTGPFANIPRQWKRVEQTIPTTGRSQMQQRHLENCEWLMLKIIALDGAGTPGYLYVDDVKIEEVGLADKVDLTPGGATKGFDGRRWDGSTSEAARRLTPMGGPQKVQQK